MYLEPWTPLPWRMRRPAERIATATTLIARPFRQIQLRPPTGAVGTLLAAGDIGLYKTSVADETQLLTDLLPLWKQADVRLGNLESVCTTRTHPAGSIGSCLRADAGRVRLLRDTGFTAMTVANNHSLDFGSDALAESIDLLKQAGIHTCGHTSAPDLPGAAAIFEAKNVRFGMLGFCDIWRVPVAETVSVAPAAADPDAMVRAVTELAPQVDICIVQIHWGYEFSLHPLRSHRDIARNLAAAGAGLVLCHHAHVPMGVERFGNSVIAHGLGNFLMPPDEYMLNGHQWSKRSFVLKVSFSREGIHTADVIPIYSAAGPSVHLQQAGQRSSFLRALARMSHALNNTERLDRCERTRVIYEAHRTAQGLFDASGTELLERALLLTTPCYQQAIQGMRMLPSRAGERVAGFFAEVACQARDASGLSCYVARRRSEVEAALEQMGDCCYRWQDAFSARIP